MRADTKEWVIKAEGDFHDAQRGIRARSVRSASAAPSASGCVKAWACVTGPREPRRPIRIRVHSRPFAV